MVLHPDYDGVEVYVVSEGRRLGEYRDANDDGQSGTPLRYIQATSSAAFEICVEIPRTFYYSINARPLIDGMRSSGRTMSKEYRQWNCFLSGCISRVDGGNVYQAFRFSQLVGGKSQIHI
jgi:hypothetical protein